ncbi:hypothetical protein M0P98_02435 [bacterium]|nr:hypothetical protein [bacterium]
MKASKFNIFPVTLLFLINSFVFKYNNLECQEVNPKAKIEVLNPYEDVDWEKFEYVHSFSHQHGNRSPSFGASPETFWNMGFRHLPFSNYYPSTPAPLSEDFRKKYPDALWGPNAERSATGIGHFNVLESYYSTGAAPILVPINYKKNKVSPFEYEFTGLNAYDSEQPWLSIYNLQLVISGKKAATLSLTLEGAQKVNPSTYELPNDSLIKGRQIPAKSSTIFIRTDSDKMKIRFDFNPEEVDNLRVILRQTLRRPWQDAFKAALDGTLKDADGNPIEGLRFPDGGGITLNHTVGPLESILEKLNFDKRVLGIEIWNYRRSFGPKSSLGFYKLWDDVLKTGTRCFGFFVKDHFIYESGRNVLLLPPFEGLSIQEREHNAAKAYRNGVFYGLIGALAVDENQQKVNPYDYSDFRFTKISLIKDNVGIPESIEVAVDGADKVKRPNIQIRFITDKGVSLVENNELATYKLTKDENGKIVEKYVRVEAFAYPSTHLQGQPLTTESFTSMNVQEMSRLHDYRGGGYKGTDLDRGQKAIITIVDMIFSQPIMFR